MQNEGKKKIEKVNGSNYPISSESLVLEKMKHIKTPQLKEEVFDYHREF